MKNETKNIKPEWAPDNSGSEFASFVSKGVENIEPAKINIKSNKFSKNLTSESYYKGIISSDLVTLARAITLIESNLPKHNQEAQGLIKKIIPHTGDSIRIGITGAPGVGKSTFIDCFGVYLCNQGYKVAVLAVDPSSTRSKGSILGDKTRMEQLSQNANAFIRPSPSGGNLGGVARKTRETILLCEAAGYDVILIETVGVGQSEVVVRSMVDFFLLLLLPGAGDELQGIKKGSVELADALIINKADSDNIIKANVTKEAYKQAIHYILPATEGWTTDVFTCSALEGKGISEIWSVIKNFEKSTKESGMFDSRRSSQVVDWLHSLIEESLKSYFYNNHHIKNELPNIEKSIVEGGLTVPNAVTFLMNLLK